MRKKIVHVITRMDWAGAPDLVRILCQAQSAVYDVTLVYGASVHMSAETRKFFQQQCVAVKELFCLQRDINLIRDIRAFIQLIIFFRSGEFDIVHTHTAKAGFLGRLAAKIAGIAQVVHMPHGHNFYGYYGARGSWAIVQLEKFAARYTQRLIALTELEKNAYVERGIVAPEKVTVVPSGIDFTGFDQMQYARPQKRHELGFHESAIVVGLVSRLEPIKGPRYFIEAAAAIHRTHEDVVFVVVGEGSLRAQLQAQADAAGMRACVHFLHWRDDARQIIACLDVLVQPSLNEAVGCVLIEAQALGVPVVASRVGGIPEIIEDGITGVLVESQDTAAFAGAVVRVLEDGRFRRGLAERALVRARQKFSAEHMIVAVQAVYEGVS